LSTGTFQKVPGPGSYRVPSEFGHYESKAAATERLNGSTDKKDSPKKYLKT